jgi:hypothetical protein
MPAPGSFQPSIESFRTIVFHTLVRNFPDLTDAVARIGLARIKLTVRSRRLWWLRREIRGGNFGFLIAGNTVAGYPGISAEALTTDPSASGQLSGKNLSDQARVARPALQQVNPGWESPAKQCSQSVKSGGHSVEY